MIADPTRLVANRAADARLAGDPLPEGEVLGGLGRREKQPN